MGAERCLVGAALEIHFCLMDTAKQDKGSTIFHEHGLGETVKGEAKLVANLEDLSFAISNVPQFV